MHAIAFRLTRLVFWIALALYLGGLFALGAVAAPKVFETLRQSNSRVAETQSALNDPSQLGGEVFGNILMRFSWFEVGFICVLILAVFVESILLRGAMLRKPWHLLRIAILVIVAGLLAYDTVILWPQVTSKRAEWRAATDPAAATTLKADFDTLHKRSESLAHTKVYALLAMLALTVFATTPVPAALPAKPKPAPEPQPLPAIK